MYAGGQTLNLYENVTLSGGWTVYPISYIVVENTSVVLWCKRNDNVLPAYQIRSFDESIFGNALQKFASDPLVRSEPGTLKLKIDRFSKKYEGDWECAIQVNDPDHGLQARFGPTRKVELASERSHVARL